MEYVIYLIVAVGIFVAGYFTNQFFRDYRLRAMVLITHRDKDDYTCEERLEKILDTWLNLRSLFYSWRGSLTGPQYLAAVTLMSELDRRLDWEQQGRNEDEDLE